MKVRKFKIHCEIIISDNHPTMSHNVIFLHSYRIDFVEHSINFVEHSERLDRQDNVKCYTLVDSSAVNKNITLS